MAQQSPQGQQFNGRKVAILVADLFEQAELAEPKKALEAGGMQADVVSDHGPQVRGMRHHQQGDTFKVDVSLADANPQEYDALVLPGGVV
jgi:deglycase